MAVRSIAEEVIINENTFHFKICHYLCVKEAFYGTTEALSFENSVGGPLEVQHALKRLNFSRTICESLNAVPNICAE